MARQFDGTADYLVYGGVPISGYPFTLACWASCDDFSSDRYFFQFGNSTVDTHRCGLNFFGGGNLAAAVRNLSTTRTRTTTTSVSTGTWAHCAGVFTSTYAPVPYLNGNSSATGDTASITFPTFNRTALGALQRLNVIGFLHGKLAEAAIWSADLDQSEITELASGASPLFVRPKSLVAYWPLFGRNGASGDEEDWVGGRTQVQVSSPAVADHPRIVYPSRKTVVWTPQVSAYTHPTLSLATLVAAGGNTYQPRVTYTF